jgi:hypothetical protein
MKLSINPSVTAPRNITAESLALAGWYDSHPSVRRLWGIKVAQGLRVIVVIEPTLDNDDVFPGWLANSSVWSRELHLQTGRCVQLELVKDLPCDGIEVDPGSVVIADLFWRDATLSQPHEVDMRSWSAR